MALPNSTQIRQPEQTDPDLVRKCFRQDVMIQNYAQFTHRTAALQMISTALAAQAANGAPREVLARGITQFHQNLIDVIASAERIPYE